MEFYHFSEQPYTDAWELGLESLRNDIPNRYCDPAVANRLYHERIDEWLLCDELGLNIMFNEHHTTATCLSVSPTLHLAMMARMTKKARLLALGIPIANRLDPLRVAEELAMIDVISGGRLEIGLVKGAPYEISPANSNPGRFMERFWEAHDLILELLSSRDGPFNFEGEFFHYRQANIWPQPWQQPHPPVWITAGSPESTVEIARRGHRLAVFLSGWKLKELMDLYKKTAVEAGGPAPGADRFGYLALVAVGATEEEAHRRLHHIQGWQRTAAVVAEPFVNPPGYMSPQGNAQWLSRNQVRGRAGNHHAATTRDGRVINTATASVQELIDAGVAFAGTPEQVIGQISAYADQVGGVGHLLMMCHGGTLSHADTMDSLSLFAREVMPALKERHPAGRPSRQAAE